LDYITKSARPQVDSMGKCLIEVPRYRGANPKAGDRVFLWFTDAKYGEGLAGIASLEAVRDGNPATLALVVSGATPVRPLNKATLAPFRNSGDGTAQGGLSAKLYRHSLHKVAELSATESAYLETFFAGAAPEALEPPPGPVVFTRDHPTIRKIEVIVNSEDGRRAVIAASDAGRPGLAGLDQRLRDDLGAEYLAGEPTSWAGKLVSELMVSLGYTQAGRRSMPEGSVAKTATFFEKR
jgi:hypothetical protein